MTEKIEQWVDLHPIVSMRADTVGLKGEDKKAFLAGCHLRNRALTLGWVDNGTEGALEYVSRITYETAVADTKEAYLQRRYTNDDDLDV